MTHYHVTNHDISSQKKTGDLVKKCKKIFKIKVLNGLISDIDTRF